MKKIFTLVTIVAATATAFSQCYSSISSKGFHNLAIKSDGTLWAWGRNDEDQLGDNSNADQSAPVQIGTEDDWVTVSAGTYYSAAIKADGTLWAWGSNTWGQTGPNSADNPQMIGTDNDWVAVATGLGFTSAIKSDGTLWMWGFNTYGQLGNGTTTNSSTPAQVGTDTDWAAVSNGSQHVLALKTNGTLWAWGSDDGGSLGLGTLSDQHIPTQVGIGSNWAKIYAGYGSSAAIKTDGTLWAWGYNNYGMVGDGTIVNKQSPTQIGTDADWSKVALTTHTMAVKTDGTLWAWGRNNFGKIGNGMIDVNQLTPVQIGSDTDWIMAIPGFEHSIAIKGNGTTYTWGHNNEGQLGDDTLVDKISPFQIGSECTAEFCSFPANELVAVNAECAVEFEDLAIPSVVDSCGNVINATLYTGSFPIVSEGTTTILWKFSNASGFVTVPQDITIDDVSSPLPNQEILDVITAQCSVAFSDIEIPTADDGCNGLISATTTALFPIATQGTTVITWTYDDGNGNTTVQNQNITIDDTIAPLPNSAELPVLTAQCSISDITPPIATDNCTGIVMASTSDPLSYDEQGDFAITWIYSDANGNTASQAQAIIIADDVDPVVLTQDIEVDLDGNSSVSISPEDVNNGTTDNCNISILSLDIDSFGTVGQYVVTLTAIDSAGNSTSQTAIVTVTDSSLGIVGHLHDELIVYPIPANDLLYVKIPNEEVLLSLSIYDILGRRVLFREGAAQQIDIRSLGRADYYLVVETSHGIYKKVVMVQ